MAGSQTDRWRQTGRHKIEPFKKKWRERERERERER